VFKDVLYLIYLAKPHPALSFKGLLVVLGQAGLSVMLFEGLAIYGQKSLPIEACWSKRVVFTKLLI
jgi:hypothetical protein